MSITVFVFGYYTVLLAASCIAAYFNQRSVFLLLFTLTLVSFVLGIVGGAGALQAVAMCAGLLALAGMISYGFREFLIQLAEADVGAPLRGNSQVFLTVLAVFVALAFVSSSYGWGLTEIFVALAVLILALVPLSPDTAKELRTAPMTAAFGLFVVFTYAVLGVFAPYIAPHGEAEVIASAFAPRDESMLLGADQLGRDMFSRIRSEE